MHRATSILNHLVQSASDNVTQSPTSATNSFPSGLLHNQVAIITGSGKNPPKPKCNSPGQGIGEAAAVLFAQEGAKVVVTDIDKGKKRRTFHEILNLEFSEV